MRECVLNIGDVRIFDDPVTMICYGLGSCVGLFMQDRTIGLSGGAHILLPANMNTSDRSGKYNVEQALTKILEEFKRRGSSLIGLRAKISGGGNVLKIRDSVGEKNVRSLIDLLIKNGIYIAAAEVGGFLSRSVKFDSSTGVMQVKTVEDSCLKVL